MDFSYESSNIATARSLQVVNYITVSTAVVLAYDYCIQLGDEVYHITFRVRNCPLKANRQITYICTAKWGKVKVFYLLARYLPFAMLAVRCFGALNPYIKHDFCSWFYLINSWLEALSLFFAELIFVLRTYALWERNKRVLVVLLCSTTATVIGIITLIVKYQGTITFGPSPAPIIAACYQVNQDNIIAVAYALLFLFELEILSFNVYRAFKHYQNTHNHLLRVLIQHSVFYFTCGLAFSIANILIIVLFKGSYSDVFPDMQAVIHAVLVTRMQVNLWKSDRANPEVTSVPLTNLGQLEFAHSALQTTSAPITSF